MPESVLHDLRELRPELESMLGDAGDKGTPLVDLLLRLQEVFRRAEGILATLVYSTLSYGWTLVAPAFTLLKMLTLLGIALAFSVGLCVISAIYPVYFAAKLEPADAMRYEV